jgi:hypothetical protein
MNALEILRRKHAETTKLLARLRQGTAGVADVDRSLRELLEAEREHLFPILEGRDEIADLVERTFREHEEIEDVLAELERTPADDAELPAIAEELEAVCVQHFDDEEHELYPAVQTLIGDEELETAGQKMTGPA